MRALKIGIKVFIIIIVALILLVLSYVVYVVATYNRIPDNEELKVNSYFPSQFDTSGTSKNTIPVLERGVKYSALTYNVGFGAYDHDFSFFMDIGYMADGTEKKGTMSRASDVGAVNRNIEACMKEVNEVNPDLLLFQEVDVVAHRSYKVNQQKMLLNLFSEGFIDNIDRNTVTLNYTFATNFHSAYLFYPVNSPIGQIRDSGLLTVSKYKMDSAVRRSFPVDDSFPTKFFDLDRCFSVNRMPINQNGSLLPKNELVLINTHMSAYDEGGTIRKAQMKYISEIMTEEYNKGNWVIVGGDFNHALGGSESNFKNEMNLPPWVQPFASDMLPAGFNLVIADNNSSVATVRDTSIPYEKGVNYEAVLDGFIVSDNVTAAAKNIDADYEGSDHNPVQLEFSLR